MRRIVASWSRQGDGSVCYYIPGRSAKGELICGIPKCHFVGSQYFTLTHSRCYCFLLDFIDDSTALIINMGFVSFPIQFR